MAVSVPVAAMPSADDQLIAFDLIDRVHASLQHLGSGDYAPLVRTGMARAKSVAGIDAFTLTYGTQYLVGPAAEGNTMHTVSPDIVDLQMT